MKYLSYAFLALLTAFPFVSRASIASKLNDLEDCRVAITNAIVSKGGTASGALTNAAAEIAALPSGGGWSKKPWKNDGKAHIWIVIEDCATPVRIYVDATSSTGTRVSWGDTEVDTLAAQASWGVKTVTHTYAANGVYEVVIDNFNLFRIGRAFVYEQDDYVLKFAVKQIELPQTQTVTGNAFKNLIALEHIYISSLVSSSFSSECFSGCISLRSCETPSVITSLPINCFYNCSSLESIFGLGSLTTLNSSCFTGCSKLFFNRDTINSFTNAITFSDPFYSTWFQIETIANFPKLTNIGSAFQNAFNIVKVVAPNVSVVAVQTFRYNGKLAEVAYGELSSGDMANDFNSAGSSVSPDANGVSFRCFVKNTMATIMAMTNFASAANTGKKSGFSLGWVQYVCSDGQIRYSTSWTQYPWTSVSELPVPGYEYYTYSVNGTNYRWNDSTSQYEVVP